MRLLEKLSKPLLVLLLLAVLAKRFQTVESSSAWSDWSDEDEDDDNEDDIIGERGLNADADVPYNIPSPGTIGILNNPPQVPEVPAPDASGDHHSHHNHNIPEILKTGGAATNYVTHNETCGAIGNTCSHFENLVCSTATSRCVCMEGFIYVRSTETCWTIPKSDQDTCSHDVQCHAGKWGSISRCSKVSSKCECFDYGLYPRPTVYVDGVCYIAKAQGDLCHTHEECNGPIKGEAYCKPGDHQASDGTTFNGSCQCKDGHMWHNPMKSCLPLATKINDSCIIDTQCTDSPLGRLSGCNLDTAQCQCVYRGNPNVEKKDVVYYPRVTKCFLKKEYNDSCTDVDECRANLGPDVQCGSNEDFTDQSVCHCPKGKTCRSGSVGVHASAAVIASLVMAAVFVKGACGGVQWSS